MTPLVWVILNLAALLLWWVLEPTLAPSWMVWGYRLILLLALFVHVHDLVADGKARPA